jgi:hypothetical protein
MPLAPGVYDHLDSSNQQIHILRLYPRISSQTSCNRNVQPVESKNAAQNTAVVGLAESSDVHPLLAELIVGCDDQLAQVISKPEK